MPKSMWEEGISDRDYERSDLYDEQPTDNDFGDSWGKDGRDENE